MTNKFKIILASSSVYRKKLLNQLELPNIAVIAPNIPETPKNNENPQELALRLSLEKAKKIADDLKNNNLNIIIGSDQVAVFQNKIYGKPGDYETAVKILQLINNKIIYFYTGLTVINTQNNIIKQSLNTTKIKLRKLSLMQIKNYLIKTKPFNCTMGIKSEKLGIALLEYIETNDPSALIGLPLINLTKILTTFGVDPLANK